MAELKTKATKASVTDYLARRASDTQRADCKALIAMMTRVTGEKPRMWGPTIVGFGSYRYTYESGRSGEICITGFAIRGRDLVVYVLPETKAQKALLAKVGKHSMGKSCLYFRQLADLDAKVLEKLIASCVAETRRRYPDGQ